MRKAHAIILAGLGAIAFTSAVAAASQDRQVGIDCHAEATIAISNQRHQRRAEHHDQDHADGPLTEQRK